MLAPLIVAGLVLCVAGVAKLRDPAPATLALRALGLPAADHATRAFAACELTLGAGATIAPSTITAAALACVYAGFAVLVLVLSRRRAACGCFGSAGTEASPGQAAISAALALACAAAAIAPPHGIPWVLDRPSLELFVLAIGVVASVFGTVVAYTELPSAWNAWSER
jgi:hypothetical protein